MVRPVATVSFSFAPRGPATAAPAVDAYDRAKNIAFLAAFGVSIAFVVLFFVALVICTCYCRRRRSHREPPTAASMAQDLFVDEISVTIYAEDETKTDGDGSESCAICLEDFAAGEEVRALPRCKHAFHKGCIDRWLIVRSKSTCPLCRDRIVIDRRRACDEDDDQDSYHDADDSFPTVDSRGLDDFYGDDDGHTADDSFSVFSSEM